MGQSFSLLTARPWAERGSRFTLDLFLFLTARPWAERGSRFTLDLFLFLTARPWAWIIFRRIVGDQTQISTRPS